MIIHKFRLAKPIAGNVVPNGYLAQDAAFIDDPIDDPIDDSIEDLLPTLNGLILLISLHVKTSVYIPGALIG
jgi:hypothetical protein